MSETRAEIAKLMAEPADTFDDLRIIARDSDSRLDGPTRRLIDAAADELEMAQRMLIICQARLIETQRRLIAVNERLIEVENEKRPLDGLPMTISSGWLVIGGYRI